MLEVPLLTAIQKTDEYIYGRVNIYMDNLGKQNHGFVPLSMLKASLLTLKRKVMNIFYKRNLTKHTRTIHCTRDC